jgi:hypothetical protein
MGYHASRINIDIRWRTLLGDFMEEFLRYVVEYVLGCGGIQSFCEHKHP